MLEGVLKVSYLRLLKYRLFGFNPWYVGGGVKSIGCANPSIIISCFNPWYVGGGVKRMSNIPMISRTILVSILGMLEGVLKEGLLFISVYLRQSFNPWYVGGC